LLLEVAAVHLIEVLGDDGSARHWRMAFIHQHGRGSRGIDDQKIAAALPGPLLDQTRSDAVFAECKPHKARMGGEGMVEKGRHANRCESTGLVPSPEHSPETLCNFQAFSLP